jgi:redox-sensitive bicupin YhaK (pirin superfamily)
MTAGAGILHEEYHSETFTRSGGNLEMVQLWVNLPAKDKMTAPGYQAILARDIPAVALPGGAGTVRVIAGDYEGHAGPARTFTPMQVWDLRMNRDAVTELPLRDGWNSALVVLHGTVLVNDSTIAREAQLVLLNPAGSGVTIEANNDAVMLLLSGEPIDEPIVGQGPFVMNSQEEIAQAIADFNEGRFAPMPQA